MYDLLWTKKATVHLLLLNKNTAIIYSTDRFFLLNINLIHGTGEKKEFPEESDTSASLLIDVRTGGF